MIAQEVLDSTQSLGSYLVIQQLTDLKRMLAGQRTNTVVTSFLEYLDKALKARLRMYQWLSKGDRQH
ncbi:hypothetical protein Afil01_28670 [Actinorhabdospora filicis]|uniref:Uncharacterized protein n=1 Tax=Actinorhabdospora filicis TaxID=1785913 RepID=A0A9W6SLE2_9ACTN|nr:hypothetical protein [Actinorhabdospora filicis]GLZ78060.1 hypothetical protein Afil01_28670 [Actinorhabdospora filicis]